jgi:hypothetical protein
MEKAMTTAADIVARLNAPDAVRNGMSNGDAVLAADGSVRFTYDAPVISGACLGTITFHADGSVHDDAICATWASPEAWLADFDEALKEGEEDYPCTGPN